MQFQGNLVLLQTVKTRALIFWQPFDLFWKIFGKMERQKVTVYLVRHGESLRNVSMGGENIMNTSEMGLTEKGIKQVDRLGEHLSDVNFYLVFSSDYRRAVQTAEGVLKCNKNSCNLPKIETSIKLRDMNFGTLEQASYSKVIQHYIDMNKPLQDWTPPDGEKFLSAGKRMADYIDDICIGLFGNPVLKMEDSCNVLIVSHSMSICAYMHFLSYSNAHVLLNFDRTNDVKMFKNASYSKLQISKASSSILTSSSCFAIDFIEKRSVKHLHGEKDNIGVDLSTSEQKGRTAAEEAKRVRKFLASSSKGQEVINCFPQ